MQVFKISSLRLAELYKDLRSDGWGKDLTPAPEEIWAKAGCGYFCADCLAQGVHAIHPACDIKRRD